LASPVGHALIGIGAAALVAEVTGTPPLPALWIGAIVASIVPDLDLIGEVVGPPGRHVHRGATHSLLVLGGLALVGMGTWRLLLGTERIGLGLEWLAALLSHPLFDVITTGLRDGAGGYGIPLFWPLSSRRWYLVKPIYRSIPRGAYLSSTREVWRGLSTEVSLLAPLTIALVLIVCVF
jgi:membrane-bound metal-dependent hydrolase YbcI (DUF457 family)